MMMMKMIKDMLKKHKELLMYIFFGVLTTVVNFIAFGAFNNILGKNFYLVSNAIAWIISVVFAYMTNKLFVFHSNSFAPKTLFKELIEFFVARIFSFIIEEFGMWLFIDVFDFDVYHTSTELEALLLENRFIKQYMPKYKKYMSKNTAISNVSALPFSITASNLPSGSR